MRRVAGEADHHAHALLRRGVRVLERGAWFISSVHDDAVIDATLAAARAAAGDIA